jgi:molybdopterin/thiamine biosynthesis adenylyltransferase
MRKDMSGSPEGSTVLTDAQLQRFGRQILLHDFDVAGQEALQAATVLIVGLGGLGSPAALYLAAAGVGNLVLADGDAVESSNLQRQVIHTEADIGSNKAKSAAATVAAINSDVRVRAIDHALVEAELVELLHGVDLVVDASDNYPIRFALNRACIAAGIPLVSAAAVRTEGQLAVFYPAAGGPCYRCLYPQAGDDTALSCSDSGVLGPVVGVLGSLQALEAIKCLANFGEPLIGRLLVMDFRTVEIQRLALARRSDCPDCQHLERVQVT